MSVERLLSIVVKRWRFDFFKPKHAAIVSIICIGLISLMNLNTLFTFGYEFYENKTLVEVACWGVDGIPDTYFMNTWSLLHAIVYSYVPFTCLVITNASLLFMLKKQSRISIAHGFDELSSRQAIKQRSITITIIIITLSFVLFTGTGAVVNFFIHDLVKTYTGNVIITLGDTLCFMFHGLNIISLLATNIKFRKEFKTLFKPPVCFTIELTTSVRKPITLTHDI